MYNDNNVSPGNQTGDNEAENSRTYVYPHADYSMPGGNREPDRPPQKNSRAIRIIGFIAASLAVVILFSAITGGLVYTIFRSQLPQETTTTFQEQETTLPAETTAQTATAPRQDLTDRHFSLEDAAARNDGSRKVLSVMEIADQGKPAVVAITIEVTVRDFFGQVGRVDAAGSGFIITSDGFIVTNNHVVNNAEVITVVLDNGDVYDAYQVGSDPRNDIAVLKIDASELPTVVLGDSSDIMVGELAVAIGNPLGQLSGTVTAGIISGLDRQITIDGQTLTLLQTDAAINQGNSGGALFNSFGEVIGINTAKSAGAGIEGLGFAIPINHAKPIIEDLIRHGYVAGRPKIGVMTRDISPQMADYYDLPQGVYIVEVETGSAAARAGLRRADIIIGSNGIETLTTDAVNDVKETLQPGDEMVLTIVRDGETMDITVVLEEDIPASYTPAASGSRDGN